MTPEQQDLVEQNVKLIHWAATKYRMPEYEYDDRFQIAAIGLCKAATTYNPDKGREFTTYGATCMRNELLIAARYAKRRPPMPSLDAFADGTDIPIKDMLIGPDNTEESVLRNEVSEMIAEALSKLSVRDRWLIDMRLRGKTFRECAKVAGITYQRVQRIEEKFKNTIKRPEDYDSRGNKIRKTKEASKCEQSNAEQSGK
jgi:RNA polymerase sigma factor (sigma-70 family)